MLDLDAIEAALAKMTPEPWGVADYTPDEIEVVCGRNGDLHVAFYNNNPKGRHDAAGIALLRNNADAMVKEIRRKRQFVADFCVTCYPCETCGHARTTRECLWCERDRLRELCGEAANSIADADIKSSLVDRLRAASKGEL